MVEIDAEELKKLRQGAEAFASIRSDLDRLQALAQAKRLPADPGESVIAAACDLFERLMHPCSDGDMLTELAGEIGRLGRAEGISWVMDASTCSGMARSILGLLTPRLNAKLLQAYLRGFDAASEALSAHIRRQVEQLGLPAEIKSAALAARLSAAQAERRTQAGDTTQ